jgi:hypothetical protein
VITNPDKVLARTSLSSVDTEAGEEGRVHCPISEDPIFKDPIFRIISYGEGGEGTGWMVSVGRRRSWPGFPSSTSAGRAVVTSNPSRLWPL